MGVCIDSIVFGPETLSLEFVMVLSPVLISKLLK